MTVVYKFEISHPDLDETATTEADGPDYRTVAAMIDSVREAAALARKDVASRLVDYDSFGNDSAYLDRLDQVRDETLVVGVAVRDGIPKRYAVDGTYNGDGGPWSDWVEGVDTVEAEFQAKWTMAENEGAERREFGDFLDTMDGIDIDRCEPEPTTKNEYREALQALLRAAMAAGLDGPEVDLATRRLTEDGFRVEVHEVSAPAP